MQTEKDKMSSTSSIVTVDGKITSNYANSTPPSLKSMHTVSNPSTKKKPASSPLRQLLPIALCIISFATVLSILIVYMDTTEIRHQQFRLNMSRDYDLTNVPQDDPGLISYIRNIHLKKYPMTFIHDQTSSEEVLNFTNSHEMVPEMAHFISNLTHDKKNGVYFQSLAGSTAQMMTAPWLTGTMNWGGYLVEADPRKYFWLRKRNAFRPDIQAIHACLSPSTYPKEVTLHDDETEVRINSILEEETEWFHSRVKCFPVYSLLLAVNKTEIDLLSLGCQGQELEVLQTIPFDKVKINIISIHLAHFIEEDDNTLDINEYVQNISKFLLGRSYKMEKHFDRNYIYKLSSYKKTNDNPSNEGSTEIAEKPSTTIKPLADME